MRRAISILILLVFTNCSNKSYQFLIKNTEDSFRTMIRKTSRDNSEEIERYLRAEGEFILNSRKKFFSNVELENLQNFYMIEIFNLNYSDSYSAYISDDSNKVHVFKGNIKYESSYDKIELEKFHYPNRIISCLFHKAKNNLNELIGLKDDSLFDFKVYITIVKKGKISTYKAKNICFTPEPDLINKSSN